jgi:hypothetical protein
MLISFTVENFRSFGAEQELSAIANTRHANLAEHLVEVPEHEQKLLPLLAIYGANGAGKSNLVVALAWLWHHLTRASPTDYASAPRTANAFLPPDRPTRMELRFLAGRTVYAYGLTALAERFETEWFSVVKPSGAERVIFERRTSEDGRTVIEHGKGLESPTEKMRAMQIIGALQTELFFTKVIRDVAVDELPESFRAALEWFRQLVIVEAGAPYLLLEERIQSNPKFKAYLADLLQRMDTGVATLVAEQKEFPASELPNAQRSAFDRAAIGERFGVAGKGRGTLVKVDTTTVGTQHLVAEHVDSSGRRVKLPFRSESDGTRRIAELAPAVFEAGLEPWVFVIDELDRSLHALVVKAFVEEFLSRARGHQNQLIFTTHETHVLDQELLRRDEVWFVEKDKDGASQLFSLDDFPVRTDLRLDRGYLMGRFGAIPATHGLP